MMIQLPQAWQAPPTEFSLAPFWFWNDTLTEAEISRQLDAFQAHGVDAFVLHPRVGLPRHMGWMSRALLDMMRFGIEQAQARGMWVILYDEGMYPSGSSSGQVVAENPAYHVRGLVRVNLSTAQPDTTCSGVRIGADGQPALAPDQHLVAVVDYEGQRYALVDRPIDSVIRGLHFLHEDANEPPEDSPPAADLLNPEAVACFVRLVYDRFYTEFEPYFGSTIRAIFTDEPHLLGRLREPETIMPWTTGILPHLNAFLGYDLTPHLSALWDDTAPPHIFQDFERAIEHRLRETYYSQLHDWCAAHDIALTGHPAQPDATAHMRFFHWPGQDIVWRYIEPDQPSALEGRQSTQAKAAASVMLHQQRRRNANEFCGAYGADFTYDEMRWLANWLLIRGCNLLIPHAFYYSVRGPRKHERPPDVGLYSPWWGEPFAKFAAACRRLAWLNTDSQHICQVAILGENHSLPWRAAKVCFEHQIDFNYLDVEDLRHTAEITADGVEIADQRYHVLIVDGDPPPGAEAELAALADAGRIIRWGDDLAAGLESLRQLVPATITVTTSCPGLRVRHVRKAGLDWWILFNEQAAPLDTALDFEAQGILDPITGMVAVFEGRLQLAGHELCVVIAKS
ncbi:MAG: hypothetical protein JXA10_11990 [Anaerolineae bacterium]|nr:hypothetical protein [Anaerolineae bacterium]